MTGALGANDDAPPMLTSFDPANSQTLAHTIDRLR
jgi:hypothetical protein